MNKQPPEVMEAGLKAGSYIAVGSGTINDLAKFSAARQGKRCAVFATAPSMNGYTSVNVAITIGGHKKSLPAVAPEGVFCDLRVLAAAPVGSSGQASAMRSAAAPRRPTGTWRIACAVRATAPRLSLSSPILRMTWWMGPSGLIRGDTAAIETLMRVLLLSGFGMTICGGSYPGEPGRTSHQPLY